MGFGDSNKVNLSVRLRKAMPLHIYNLYRKELYAYIRKNNIDVSNIATDKRKIPSYFWKTSKKLFCNNKKNTKAFETAFANVSYDKLIKDARKDGDSKRKLNDARKLVRFVLSATYDEIHIKFPSKRKEETPTEDSQTTEQQTEEKDFEDGSLQKIAQQIRDKYHSDGYWETEYFAKAFYNNELDSEYTLLCQKYDNYVEMNPTTLEKCDIIDRDELIEGLETIGRVRYETKISSKTLLGVELSHKYRYMIVYLMELDEVGMMIQGGHSNPEDFFPELFKEKDFAETKKKMLEVVKRLRFEDTRKKMLKVALLEKAEREKAEKEKQKRESESMRKDYEKLLKDFQQLRKKYNKLKNKKKK